MRRLLAPVVVGLALAQAGCPTFSDDAYLYREGFQDCPSGCGWLRTAGEPSDATIADTLHGERGLQLCNSVVVMHTLEGVWFDPRTFTTGSRLALDAIVRCDVGSRVEVQVAATDERGMPQSFDPPVFASPTWDAPRSAFSALQGFGGSDPVIISLDALVLTKTGSGVCELDEIGILLDAMRFSR